MHINLRCKRKNAGNLINNIKFLKNLLKNILLEYTLYGFYFKFIFIEEKIK